MCFRVAVGCDQHASREPPPRADDTPAEGRIADMPVMRPAGASCVPGGGPGGVSNCVPRTPPR